MASDELQAREIVTSVMVKTTTKIMSEAEGADENQTIEVDDDMNATIESEFIDLEETQAIEEVDNVTDKTTQSEENETGVEVTQAPKQLRGTIEVSGDTNTITIRIKKADSSTDDNKEQNNGKEVRTGTKNKAMKCLIQAESSIESDIQDLADGNLKTSLFTVSCIADGEEFSTPKEGTSNNTVPVGCNKDTPASPTPPQASGRSESAGTRQCGSEESKNTSLPPPCTESYFMRLYGPNSVTTTVPCDFRSSYFRKMSGCSSRNPCSCSCRPRTNYCSKYYRKISNENTSPMKATARRVEVSACEEVGRVKEGGDKEKKDNCEERKNDNEMINRDPTVEEDVKEEGEISNVKEGNGSQDPTLEKEEDEEGEVVLEEKVDEEYAGKGEEEKGEEDTEKEKEEAKKEEKENEKEEVKKEEKGKENTNKDCGKIDMLSLPTQTRRNTACSPTPIPSSRSSSMRSFHSAPSPTRITTITCSYARIPTSTSASLNRTSLSTPACSPTMPIDPTSFASRLLKAKSCPGQSKNTTNDCRTPPPSACCSPVGGERRLPISTLRRWRQS